MPYRWEGRTGITEPHPAGPRRLLSVGLRLTLLVATALALGACTGEVVAPNGDRPDTQGPRTFAPLPSGMQRLTFAQYQNAITDILGPGLPLPADAPEPDTSLNGFVSIGASRTTISDRGVEGYSNAAYAIADAALAPDRRDALVGCDANDGACRRDFVETFGRRFFRRDLTDAERDRYTAVADQATTVLGDGYEGLEFALAGLMQSPNFLFRIELGEPDAESPSRLRYTDHEMASRLSFVLWNSTPDDALLAAADAGELTTDEGLRAQVDRMLLSDRARGAVRNFFRELLRLDEVALVEKDLEVFPTFTPALRASAEEETLAVLEHHTLDADADFRDVFTSDVTYVDALLRDHYGLPPAETETAGFEEVTLPEESARRGLLGHASLLSIFAHDTKTSATLRGRFVRQTLLCGSIPPPPPGVSTTLPPSSAPTLRERVAQHLMNEGCSDCHERMDPIGLGLETYDAIGQQRDMENGAMIDASGVLDGAHFADATELGQRVGEHPDLGPCLTRNLYRYALGANESSRQLVEIDRLAAAFEESGYRVRGLLGELVMSEGFRTATEPM
ncbi:MAG: DUF1592 domain-containing protein [Sandaracinaceae bacterium]